MIDIFSFFAGGMTAVAILAWLELLDSLKLLDIFEIKEKEE